ncbi:fluoride efflux transporter CrcB [Candidatus Marinamargulisbacteria bacterium SCGC AG-343-D04]|nr:fluoride efflux transporter CrcB [Candidatus Marinamargulisbacteria bacterium SCGC AG-343-D04]
MEQRKGKKMAIIIAIIVGASIGALMRYGLGEFFNVSYPYGTLWANCIGCFVCGVIWGLSLHIELSPVIKIGMLVGFCGALTTFSTIMLDIFKFSMNHDSTQAMYYFILTNISGMLSLGAGLVSVRLILRMLSGWLLKFKI